MCRGILLERKLELRGRADEARHKQETILQGKEDQLQRQHRRQVGEGKGASAEGGEEITREEITREETMHQIDSDGGSEERTRELGSTFNQQRLLERSLRSADCVIQDVLKALKLQDEVSPVTVLGARASVLLLQSFLVGLATAAGFAIRVLSSS
jgi:hypothetical protein